MNKYKRTMTNVILLHIYFEKILLYFLENGYVAQLWKYFIVHYNTAFYEDYLKLVSFMCLHDHFYLNFPTNKKVVCISFYDIQLKLICISLCCCVTSCLLLKIDDVFKGLKPFSCSESASDH